MKTIKPPSQNAIGRALNLSSATMVKLRKRGMPTHSVEAAHAWRQANVRPTVYTSALRNQARPARADQRNVVDNVHELMAIAGTALADGRSIASLVPVLRAAMAAVPARQRNAVMVSGPVMDVLVAEVAARIAIDDTTPGACAAPMDDDQAQYLGEFWYQAAAGEIGPDTPG